MNGVIYKITNVKTDKSYIGQTIFTAEKRFQQHLNRALREETFYPLASAIRKYGKDAFKMEVVGEYPANELNDWEKYWIAYYNTFKGGYNATIGGNYIPSIHKEIYDYKKLCLEYQNGKSIAEIAEEQHIGERTISNILRQNGIKILTSHEFIAKKENREFSAYNHRGIKIESFLTPSEAYTWLLQQNLPPEYVPMNLTTCANNISQTLRKGDGGMAYGYFWGRGVVENIKVHVPTRYKTLCQQVEIKSIITGEQKVFAHVDDCIVFFTEGKLTKAKPPYIKRSIMQAIKHQRSYLGYTIKFIY